MSNRNIIENWMLKSAHLSGTSLAATQIAQVYARLFFASAGLLYMLFHSADFPVYETGLMLVASIYFAINLISIPMIRRTPLSAFRCLVFPILDISVVSYAMMIDGGQSSNIFFLYLLIILGNGLRFGNPMLLYTQILSLIGLFTMITYTYVTYHIAIDQTLLFWHFGMLLAIPLYVYLIGQQVEKAVKGQMEAEKTSYNLLDKGPLPVFTFEMDRDNTPRIVYVNGAVKETFQRNGTDLIGESADILTLPEDRQEMIAFCRATLGHHHGKHPNKTETLYIRSRDISGNILKLLCTAICMRWHNRWIGVCFILDISEREAMQEELESVHRQGYMSTLVAGIVHDFRNVLTNMIGNAEVLQMSTKDTLSIQQLNAIIAAGERGSELITHLLELSKNHKKDSISGYAEGSIIVKRLENIMGLARLQMPPYIQLDCQIDTPLHNVAISMIEIEQILINLINNAAQAINKSGQIHVHVCNCPDHRLSRPGHPCMRIQVTDNGSGILDEDIDNVFEAFWTSKNGQGGTGLGLTTVQRIIKRNHGSIEVESVPNQKTRFIIHLPPYIPESSESDNTVVKKNKGTTNLNKQKSQPDAPSNCHVLLVDDVPDILKIHQSMLAHLKHTSVLAENGKEALKAFLQENKHFDLVITDYCMPKMDGLELIEHIRQLGSNIPVIMITAYAEDNQLQRADHYNATIINKPVSMEKFQQAIAEAMAAA